MIRDTRNRERLVTEDLADLLTDLEPLADPAVLLMAEVERPPGLERLLRTYGLALANVPGIYMTIVVGVLLLATISLSRLMRGKSTRH